MLKFHTGKLQNTSDAINTCEFCFSKAVFYEYSTDRAMTKLMILFGYNRACEYDCKIFESHFNQFPGGKKTYRFSNYDYIMNMYKIDIRSTLRTSIPKLLFAARIYKFTNSIGEEIAAYFSYIDAYKTTYFSFDRRKSTIKFTDEIIHKYHNN